MSAYKSSSSVSKPRVRQNRHKQGLNQTIEKLSADFRELKKLSGFKVIEDENPYYTFTKSYIDLKSQTIRIAYKEKIEHVKIPVEYRLGVHIHYDHLNSPLLFFTPDQLSIKMGNRGKKTMIFKQDVFRRSNK